MIKHIVKDTFILQRLSSVATENDSDIVKDLIDTLEANKEICAGMAANMIGINKRIIAFQDNGKITVMLNPEIIRMSDAYKTKEGCLSLEGQRETTRYRSIKVKYQDTNMKVKIKTYKDFTAQVIQHEIDHCNGILI
ncbi:peptide deformylase [uncultured Faecalicoccus sp.]|uniref:peptide deformylase n=1 Tax=uncultured Faecalicoccus sp. TaxID=1971760 RepID=UPI00260898FE|nr:peptide deformylase [uncultured Faecalicoccus sp.]